MGSLVSSPLLSGRSSTTRSGGEQRQVKSKLRLNGILIRNYLHGLVALVILTCSCCAAQQLPLIGARRLDGTTVAVPNTFQHRPAVLIFGDSPRGVNQARVWYRSLAFRGRQQGSDDVYGLFYMKVSLPFLRKASERFFVRRFTPLEKANVLLMGHSSEALRRLVVPWETDEAYILVIDANGSVFWRYAGICTEDSLRAVIAALGIAKKVPSTVN